MLLQISLLALKGVPTVATFSVIISIKGKRGVALIDSGSSHTFIDLKFATSAQCITLNNELQRVTVAGGGVLYTGAHLSNCEYNIQGEKFMGTSKVLKLQSYDVILGCDWIHAHSPIKLNLKSRELIIRKDGQQDVTLHDFTSSHPKRFISAAQLNKLCNKEVMGFMI